MSVSCKIYYDGKNDRYELIYDQCKDVELVFIGGRAMEDLFGIKYPIPIDEDGVATAVFEYLTLKGLNSTKDNPLFILPEIDLGEVRGALGIDDNLLNICKKYRAKESS